MKAVTYIIVAKALVVLALSFVVAWNAEANVNPVGDNHVSVIEDNYIGDRVSAHPVPTNPCVSASEQVAGIVVCIPCVPLCLVDPSGIVCAKCLITCGVIPL